MHRVRLPFQSVYYWPVRFCPDGRHLPGFVHRWCFIPFNKELLLTGRSGVSLGDAMTTNSYFMFLWIDFSVPRRVFKHGFCTFDFTGSCSSCSLVWPLS